MWDFDGSWSWGTWVAMVAMMGLWLALVGAVVWAALRLGSGDVDREPPSDPRAVLDYRLASGEIDVDQYVDLRRALQSRTLEPADRR